VRERERERAAFRPPFSSDLCFPLLSFLPLPSLLPIDDVSPSHKTHRYRSKQPLLPPIILYLFYLYPLTFLAISSCDIGIIFLRWSLRAPIESRDDVGFFLDRARDRSLASYVLSLFLVDSTFGSLFHFIFVLFFLSFFPSPTHFAPVRGLGRVAINHATNYRLVYSRRNGSEDGVSSNPHLPAPRSDSLGKSSICLADEKQTSAARAGMRLSGVRRR